MATEVGDPGSEHQALKWVLRGLGMLDMLALAGVFMPMLWTEQVNLQVGLGALPTGPLTGYLIRTTSALYALHGAMMFWISFDVARYRPLIAFLAWAALIHGALLAGIDLTEGMPVWWTAIEGPGFALTGVVVLLLLRRQTR